MRKANIYTSIVLLIACGYVIYSAHGLEYMQKNGVPGPGFLPVWIGILLGICMLLQLFFSLRSKAAADEKSCFDKKSVRNTLILLGSSTVAMLLVNILGMLVCLGLLTGFLTWALGIKKLKVDLAVAILVPIFFWIIFTLFLEVQFVQGVFGF